MKVTAVLKICYILALKRKTDFLGVQMDDVDFSKYSIEELRSALQAINREKYPERVTELESYLEKRMQDPIQVLRANRDADFFNSHVPSEIVTSIWLRTLGWSIVTGVFIGLPTVFIFSLILTVIGASDYIVQTLSLLLNYVIILFFSWLFLRKVLGGNLDNYELVFFRKKLDQAERQEGEIS